MEEDSEGFLYPKVNKCDCIKCNKCNMVCPVLNSQNKHFTPTICYAVYSKDEYIRSRSSSGGIFSVLANQVISMGGVVYGAAFDSDWSVHHIAVDKADNIHFLQGSKYLQSRVENTFQDVLCDLRNGKIVLYSGTPCQILGLRCFMNRQLEKFNNLFTVEIVCHGVPSPKVWKDYLTGLTSNINEITQINMRDKSRGWSRYSYLIRSNNEVLFDDFAANSPYLYAYISNYTLRPSCYKCVAKSNNSGADITIADFWGIGKKIPSIDDDKGISLVINNTRRGESLFNSLNGIVTLSVEDETLLLSNPSYSESSVEPYNRKIFWKLYPKYGLSSIDMIPKRYFLRRLFLKLKYVIFKTGL